MIIVHIITGLEVGGAELMLQRMCLAQRLNQSDRVIVISLSSIGSVGTHLKRVGIEVHAMELQGYSNIFLSVFNLIRLLRSIRPDIVQTWMYHADLLGGIAARVAGCRNVFWCVRTTELNEKAPISTRFARILCALLSYIVPIKVVFAADASRRVHIAIGYDADRMVVIPNGFEFSQLICTSAQREQLRINCGWDSSHMVCGCVGRFHPDKDQFNFIQGAALVARQHDHARFLMVGRDLDSNNSVLKRWLLDTGFADRFVLLGERSDVPVCLSAMDIFCLPSRTEGFPNVVGEAMAMGLACVVTDVGDAAFLVADTGLVVSKEDSSALAEGICKLITMPIALREQMGQKAQARIHSEFSMDRARESFEVIYKKVIESGHF